MLYATREVEAAISDSLLSNVIYPLYREMGVVQFYKYSANVDDLLICSSYALSLKLYPDLYAKILNAWGQQFSEVLTVATDDDMVSMYPEVSIDRVFVSVDDLHFLFHVLWQQSGEPGE